MVTDKTVAITLRLKSHVIKRLDRMARELSLDRNFKINRQTLIKEALRRSYFTATVPTFLNKPNTPTYNSQFQLFEFLTMFPKK
jgi:hypothetical protein